MSLWWLRNLFFSFLRARRQNRQYYYIKTQIDNNFPLSVLFSIMEMTANFAVKANLARLLENKCSAKYTTKPFFSFKGISNLTVQPMLFYFSAHPFFLFALPFFLFFSFASVTDFLDCWTPEQKPCLMALLYSNGCKFRSPYAFKKPSRTIYKENW